MPYSKKTILSGNYKTKSNIPKTALQKANWKTATGIAVKQSGKYTEKNIPWGLVNTIYQNAEKAKKQIKKSDVTKAKYSKAVSKYT
jgi:hypothetical protein